ncbi:DUF1571 domain-containing protein [Burkholderia sp. L27(2015)]|uniref:DUF1571 domain-containing protein n=1 Tax=Burkholderia sp. L27(2015) TaxID=1641858 RepID=UPI00131AB622|nr:DUF1571 domain-containing protein [Burkholderia sp. L27(2015)]
MLRIFQTTLPLRATGFARLLALVLTSAAMIAVPARAQDTTPTPAASQALPAPAADTGASGSASSTDTSGLGQVGSMPVERQVAWLNRAAQSGELAKLGDAQLVELFQSLSPDTLPRYVEAGSARYREYEFQTYSQQRIKGVWQTQPAHLLVRYRQDPMQVYVKWLADGRSAGQEMIYDETKDPKQLYAHQGGTFSFVSIWTPIDGSRALAQSNHTVRELNLGYVTELFLSELKKYHAAGIDKPSKIEVLTDYGERVVAFTWETPTGQPQFYAKKVRLGLDLRHPFFGTSEAWDNNGELFEKFTFTDVTPKHFDASTFDPKNPQYKF